MTGAGMHQQLNYNLKFQLNKQHLNNKLHNKKQCRIVILDFIEHTNYFDLDEILKSKQGNITV